MTCDELVKLAADEGVKIDLDTAGKIIEDNHLEDVAGGYPGHDKYSAGEYAQAGVTWCHHFFKKDEYYIYGYKIYQVTAEIITDEYFAYGYAPSLESCMRRFIEFEQ